MDRRKFLKNSIVAGLSIGLSNKLLFATEANESFEQKVILKKNDIILFQGDSITDCYRQRMDAKVNDSKSLGIGYVLYTATMLLAHNPSLNLQIYNRGISGDRTDNLLERWDEDCLQMKPTILSLLVGVNDYLHTLKYGYNGTVLKFRDNYIKILDSTISKFPNIRLVIGEPFYIHSSQEMPEKWKKFIEYQEIVAELSAKYNAVFIPYQKEFDNLCRNSGVKYWTPDSIHPGLPGRFFMAQIWSKYTGLDIHNS